MICNTGSRAPPHPLFVGGPVKMLSYVKVWE